MLTLALFWAYKGFNNTRENVHHLGNLINFIFIAFLPFLFVLQKDDQIPMFNVIGYLCLIPTIIVGVVLLSLFYFFLANFKAQNFLSVVNLSSMFYLFIHVNLYSSVLIRMIFLLIIIIMFANIPLKLNTFFIDSFDEIEPKEDHVENGNHVMNQMKKRSNSPNRGSLIFVLTFRIGRN